MRHQHRPAIGTLSNLVPRSPRVTVHREFDKGVVQVLPGHLDAYAPTYLVRDANCCPSFTQRDDIWCRNGRFSLSSGSRVPMTQVDIPPGDLG